MKRATLVLSIALIAACSGQPSAISTVHVDAGETADGGTGGGPTTTAACATEVGTPCGVPGGVCDLYDPTTGLPIAVGYCVPLCADADAGDCI